MPSPNRSRKRKPAAASKPPYRIPLMAEIRRARSNGLKVVSTFSGCGGGCLGFRMAGYKVVWASEFIPAARETYRANFPGVHVDDRDIRLVQPAEILAAAGLREGELDVLEGSPPCASFSTAGKRSRDWGQVKKYSDTKQRTDDLFFEYVRLLRGLRPRVFVAENVSGLVKGVAKGYFIDILRELRASGYRVECRLLDAQWLGVPQQRQRTIFVGVREDLDRAPAFPAPLPYRYSIRDAIGGLTFGLDPSTARRKRRGFNVHVPDADEPAPSVMAVGIGGAARHQVEVRDVDVRFAPGTAERMRRRGARGKLDADSPALTVQADGIGGVARHQAQVVPRVEFSSGFRKGEGFEPDEPAPAVMAHGIGGSHFRQMKGDAPSIEGYAIGREYRRLRPGQSSDKYFNLVRPDLDAPVPTVTQLGGANAGVASVVHPTEPRKFAIAELRRLCGFPDDFVLTGSYAQQWERLGRAVPPPMMRAVAEALLPVLRRA